MDIFEILQREVKIAEVAGRYTKLKHSGTRSVGCCPLPNHNDSTPSFSAYSDAHAHCYGCGFHGDVIDLWAALKGLPLGIEAALDLAHEFSVQLPNRNPDEQRKVNERRQKEADYARQAEAYHQALSPHLNVVAYLEQRGFNEELRRRFLLGANSDGSAVVIPFWHRGRIQGFIRRQLYREPKYVLPKKEDFPLGYRSLFIPGATHGDIHKVEGYFDALALAALDLSAIAIGGTGISQQQKAELEKLKGALYIFPDADDEGAKASSEWVREFYPRSRLCPAEYGEGRKDVADLFATERERARHTLEELKARAIDALDLSLSEAPKGSTRERYRYARDEVFPVLLKITDMGERNAAVDDAAKVLGLKASDLRRVLKLEIDVEGETTSESSELVLHEPAPWPEPVDGAVLLDEIAIAVNRFLSAAEHTFKTIALWTIYAYAFDLFDISPLLAITSPEKRCGKTTLLTLLYALAPRPLTVANITASALFRTVEKYHPTLLIDEADSFLTDNEELRGILNSGHRKATSYIIRTTGEDYEPRRFTTWAPKAIALIGALPGTLEDRAIVIRLQRKRASDNTERLRFDCLGEFEHLRRRAARWICETKNQLRTADPDIPSEITNDRARDNWRPLLAIADAAGGDWPQKARIIARAMAGEKSDSESARTLLLADLKAIFGEDRERLTSDEIIQALVEMESRSWAEWKGGKPLSKVGLARLLKPFGVEPTKWREQDQTQRGYLRNDFEDVFARYLIIESPQSPQSLKSIVYSEFQSPQDIPFVATGNGANPLETKSVATVAAQIEEVGREVIEI